MCVIVKFDVNYGLERESRDPELASFYFMKEDRNHTFYFFGCKSNRSE